MRGTSGVGINLTPEFFEEATSSEGEQFDFLEIDPALYELSPRVVELMAELSQSVPIAIHSTFMSMCGDNPLDADRVAQVADIVASTGCDIYSDHMSFTWAGDVNLDLYMAPVFDQRMLDWVAKRSSSVRDRVDAPFALENVGMLFDNPEAAYSEVEFLRAATRHAGIALQLNLDSVAVSAHTLGIDPERYLLDFPLDEVVTIAVVPEGSMNPILRRNFGSGLNDMMLRLLDLALEHSSADRVMVQRRFGETAESYAPIYRAVRSVYAQRRGAA